MHTLLSKVWFLLTCCTKFNLKTERHPLNCPRDVSIKTPLNNNETRVKYIPSSLQIDNILDSKSHRGNLWWRQDQKTPRSLWWRHLHPAFPPGPTRVPQQPPRCLVAPPVVCKFYIAVRVVFLKNRCVSYHYLTFLRSWRVNSGSPEIPPCTTSILELMRWPIGIQRNTSPKNSNMNWSVCVPPPYLERTSL